jgi:hypothetical protein
MEYKLITFYSVSETELPPDDGSAFTENELNIYANISTVSYLAYLFHRKKSCKTQSRLSEITLVIYALDLPYVDIIEK